MDGKRSSSSISSQNVFSVQGIDYLNTYNDGLGAMVKAKECTLTDIAKYYCVEMAYDTHLPNAGENCAAKVIKSILERTPFSGTGRLGGKFSKRLLFEVTRQVKGMGDLVHSCASNFKQLPDICIYLDGVPVIHIEVVSGSKYEATINKLLMCLVELHRLLSNYQPFCSEIKVIGYVLPKPLIPSIITKCEVQWTGLGFEVAMSKVEKFQFAESVRDAATYMTALSFNVPPAQHLSFLKLSADHLSIVSQQAFDKGEHIPKLTQVVSRSSILLKSQDNYIKVYPSRVLEMLSRVEMTRTFTNAPSVEGFLQPVLKPNPLHPNAVAVSPKVQYDPLETKEAVKCLVELVKRVGDILTNLHAHYKVAHLDVRLPNICYDSSFSPVLIDVDRVRNAEQDAWPISKMYEEKDQCLYTPRSPSCKRASNLDFMQLGLMICLCLNLDENDEVLDVFTHKLVFNGEYDKSLEVLPSYSDCCSAIKEVIEEREKQED